MKTIIYKYIINFFFNIRHFHYSFNDKNSKYFSSKVIFFLSNYLKLHISFEEICDLCGDSYKPASIYSIKKILKRLNITTSRSYFKKKSIKNNILIISRPNNCFLLIPQNHGYQVYDSLNDKISYSHDFYFDDFECIAIESKVNIVKTKWKQLYKLFSTKIIIFNFLNIIIVITTVFYSLTTRLYFDYIILKEFREWFSICILVFSLIIIIQITLYVILLLIKSGLEIKIITHLSKKLYEKILFLSLKFFENRPIGKVVDYFWTTERIGEAFLNGLITNILSIPVVIGLIIIMFYIQPIVSTIAFMVLLIYTTCILYLFLRKVDIIANMKPASEYFFSRFSDMIINVESIQTSSREQFELSKIQKYQNQYSDHFIKNTILDDLIINLNQLYIFLAPLIIFSSSIYFVTNQITIGDIVAYNTIFSIISQLILQIILSAKDYVNSFLDINTINSVSSYTNQTIDINSVTLNLNSKSGIVLSKVSFQYDMNSDYVLQNLNLEIKLGQHIALIGSNGSGKSTLLKVLMGLYHISKGKYLLGDFRVTEANYLFLQNIMGYMGQSSFIFNGTLKDNLTLWDQNIPLNVIQNAIKIAELSELVFFRGLNTVITSNNSQFSAGERQRIELARLLIKQPKFLLLDEFTANLDEFTQQKIIDNLRNHKITLIQVAHRMSAIKNCDIVYVLESGEIIFSGKLEDYRSSVRV